jgi:hypothetical protein
MDFAIECIGNKDTIAATNGIVCKLRWQSVLIENGTSFSVELEQILGQCKIVVVLARHDMDALLHWRALLRISNSRTSRSIAWHNSVVDATSRMNLLLSTHIRERESASVCVCVCVCVNQRECCLCD